MKNIDIIKSMPNHKLINFINISCKNKFSKDEILKIDEYLLTDNPNYIDNSSQEYRLENGVSKKTLNYNINKLLKNEKIDSITINRYDNLFRLSFTLKE